MRGARRAPPSARRRAHTAHEFVRAQPRTASYHASGKEALCVGLSLLEASNDEDEVLVPSYAPVGVADAVRAAGASPRFYRVESPHEPDLTSVDDAVSGSTVALVAVQYFGFPQSRMDGLRRVADDHGIALVDDASHGPLASVDGRALGTRGDVGFASFHKPLNVPDGAVLYVDGASPLVGRRSADERTRRVGSTGPRPRRTDLSHYAASAGAELCERIPALRGPLRAAAAVAAAVGSSGERDADGSDSDSRRSTGDHRTSEAAWRGEMSWAARRELRRTDPEAVRRDRREAYRVWMSTATDSEGVVPVFEDLPPGACPWVFPVVADPESGRAERLASRVDDAFRWPRLPDAVTGDATFPTANRLSRSVVCLPLRRPTDEAHARRLIEATDD